MAKSGYFEGGRFRETDGGILVPQRTDARLAPNTVGSKKITQAEFDRFSQTRNSWAYRRTRIKPSPSSSKLSPMCAANGIVKNGPPYLCIAECRSLPLDLQAHPHRRSLRPS